MVEEQPFDFGKYCTYERKVVNKAKTLIEASMTE